MIKQYQDKLDDLKAAFRDRATLYTEITVLRTMERVEIIGTQHIKICIYCLRLTEPSNVSGRNQFE